MSGHRISLVTTVLLTALCVISCGGSSGPPAAERADDPSNDATPSALPASARNNDLLIDEGEFDAAHELLSDKAIIGSFTLEVAQRIADGGCAIAQNWSGNAPYAVNQAASVSMSEISDPMIATSWFDVSDAVYDHACASAWSELLRAANP